MKKFRPLTVRITFWVIFAIGSVIVLAGAAGHTHDDPFPILMLAGFGIWLIAGLVDALFYICPHCGEHIGRTGPFSYCPHCGKLLDDIEADGLYVKPEKEDPFAASSRPEAFSDKTPEQPATTPEAPVFINMTYSPGYSDMNGALHMTKLKKDENDNWIIETRDREEIGEPETVVTYAVSDNAFKRFMAFVEDKKILDLSKRPTSGDFCTDYSPWGYSFMYKNMSTRKTEWFRFDQYKKYSDRDSALLDELSRLFEDLRGRQLSSRKETEE